MRFALKPSSAGRFGWCCLLFPFLRPSRPAEDSAQGVTERFHKVLLQAAGLEMIGDREALLEPAIAEAFDVERIASRQPWAHLEGSR